MDELHLITSRRREVEGEIARLKQELADKEGEMVELDTAGRVIARLSGAKWPSSGQDDAKAATAVSREASSGRMTMPKMVQAALRQAKAEGKPGLEPKEVTEWISKTYNPFVKGDYVSAIVWRMWKRGQLDKAENSPLYSLPGMNKAANEARGSDLAALFEPEAQGREAGPGGGT